MELHIRCLDVIHIKHCVLVSQHQLFLLSQTAIEQPQNALSVL